MTKKPAPKARKGAAKTRIADLKPKADKDLKGGKGIATTTRRQDPYKNFNF